MLDTGDTPYTKAKGLIDGRLYSAYEGIKKNIDGSHYITELKRVIRFLAKKETL